MEEDEEKQTTVEYNDDNIRHLSDMEHVRTRPGMYIGKLGDGSYPEDGIYVLLKEVIDKNIRTTSPMQMPFVTHWLNQMEQDKVLNYISHAGFTNSATDKLKIIFVPCYLDGRDGILNKPYYDLLIGMDATVYPSYYEPWGYTPLESIAFGIPTITTDLAGFGLWAKKHVTGNNISEGVAVVNRDDFNYFEVADAITSSILALAGKDKKETAEIRKRSFCLAAKAEWSKFIVYYEEAFRIALEHASKRNN